MCLLPGGELVKQGKKNKEETQTHTGEGREVMVH